MDKTLKLEQEVVMLCEERKKQLRASVLVQVWDPSTLNHLPVDPTSSQASSCVNWSLHIWSILRFSNLSLQ